MGLIRFGACAVDISSIVAIEDEKSRPEAPEDAPVNVILRDVAHQLRLHGADAGACRKFVRDLPETVEVEYALPARAAVSGEVGPRLGPADPPAQDEEGRVEVE